MPRSPRTLLVLQIACGVIIGLGIAISWLDSEVPLWESRSPDGPYYVLGWRTAVILLLLLCAAQWLSFAIFRKIKRTTPLGDFVCRYQALTAVTTALLMALIFLGWIHTAGFRGQISARIDQGNGHARLLGFGEPPPWRSDFVRLLRERHGIEFHVVAGCVVSKALVDYVDGYNQVSMRVSRRKWGRDVFKECETDALRVRPIGRAMD